MFYTGIALLTACIVLTFFCLRHDFYRFRVEYGMPQAAPRRVTPELYGFIALLMGIGSGLSWTWVAGFTVFCVYALSIRFVMLPLLDNLSHRFPAKLPKT